MPGAVRDGGPSAARAVAELEELAARVTPLREVAARLHALARRRRLSPVVTVGARRPDVSRTGSSRSALARGVSCTRRSPYCCRPAGATARST